MMQDTAPDPRIRPFPIKAAEPDPPTERELRLALVVRRGLLSIVRAIEVEFKIERS